ncbi:NAD(P)-binding protein [Ustulina deusta]|nr:NAD(P)-binding protein [Ustulina deusta]
MDISGYTLIVGGGSGIGKAAALVFAKEGAACVMCRATASNPPFQSEGVHIDVTIEGSVDMVTRQILVSFGRLDHCVINAGRGRGEEISDADIAEFRRVMDVNVTGTFIVTLAVSALVRLNCPTTLQTDVPESAATCGMIVLVGSGQSFVPFHGMTQYTASKHAVLGLTKNAAWHPSELWCPSWVDTPLVARLNVGTPGLEGFITQAVANAIIFLSSPRSSYVTGASLIINGGTML